MSFGKKPPTTRYDLVNEDSDYARERVEGWAREGIDLLETIAYWKLDESFMNRSNAAWNKETAELHWEYHPEDKWMTVDLAANKAREIAYRDREKARTYLLPVVR